MYKKNKQNQTTKKQTLEKQITQEQQLQKQEFNKQLRIKQSTNLSESLDLVGQFAEYDEAIKEILADKQVLAYILKYSLFEFLDYSIEEIMDSLDTPVISGARVEPGHTKLNRIKRDSEEDSVYGEGKIFFDIKFSAYIKVKNFKIENSEKDENENDIKEETKVIKFLMNVEAQKSTKASKLGYQIDNRIVFYLSRMVSSQKEVEFTNSDYDNIKHVRSIWICLDGEDDEDSINRISLQQEAIFGKEMKLNNLDKVASVIIRLRKNRDVVTSKNMLIAMLEELLKREDVEIKKKNLEKFGFQMSKEVERSSNIMCNLAEGVYESGIEKGIEKGKQILLIAMVKDGELTVENAAKRLGITIEQFEEKMKSAK